MGWKASARISARTSMGYPAQNPFLNSGKHVWGCWAVTLPQSTEATMIRRARGSPCTWVKPERFGNLFVLWFLALRGHCLQMLCLPGLGHTQTPRICHIFVLSLLVSRSALPRYAYFAWQTLNCQIVPVLPSCLYTFSKANVYGHWPYEAEPQSCNDWVWVNEV